MFAEYCRLRAEVRGMRVASIRDMARSIDCLHRVIVWNLLASVFVVVMMLSLLW